MGRLNAPVVSCPRPDRYHRSKASPSRAVQQTVKSSPEHAGELDWERFTLSLMIPLQITRPQSGRHR